MSWWEWLFLGFLALIVVGALALATAAAVALFLALLWVIQALGGAL